MYRCLWLIVTNHAYFLELHNNIANIINSYPFQLHQQYNIIIEKIV